MKFKVKASECFQEVEAVVEVESYEELSEVLREMRLAIKNACSDVRPDKKETVKPTSVYSRPASPAQIKYLNDLGYTGDTSNLTRGEATKIIDKLNS